MKTALICIALSLCPVFVRAQIANTTSLVGTVSDASGAVVPNSTVTAMETHTGVTSTALTNSQGYYSIKLLSPGTYNITAESNGYKTVTQHGVDLPIDQAVRTNFTLPVGSAETTVTVNANTPPLSTDDATLGETFDTNAVANLPVNGHSALDVAANASNVYVGSRSSYRLGEDFEGAGMREDTNSLSLDGVSIMDDLIVTTFAHTSAEMIASTQVQSGNYPPQYGDYLGVHINLVSKTGSNNLHGEAYEFVQNTAFNARPFIALPGSVAPSLNLNQYGFQAGGPVYIPHLYDGREKTFFFGSYEKYNQKSQATSISSVITPAMEKGDFSAPGIPQIYDPSTGLPYLGNQIPASELSTQAAQIAKNYEAYMVAPNLTGISNNLNNSFPNNVLVGQSIDRVDSNIGQNVKLFARVYWDNLSFLNGAPFAADEYGGPADSWNYEVGYSHSISPSLVNDLRFGVNKLTTGTFNYFYLNNLKNAGTSIGIPGFNGDTKYGNPGVPVLQISNFSTVGYSGSNFFQDERTYNLYDQVSYTRGKHSFAAGVEFRRIALGRDALSSTSPAQGILSVSATQYRPGTKLVSTGYSAADFVLGYVNSAITPSQPTNIVVGEWRDGFFVQDDWNVTKKLTFNYGLRYDLPTAVTSLNGYGNVLNSAQTALIPTSTATSAASWTPTPGFQFTPTQFNNWSPRFGVDYRLTEKIVLRGGVGIYYATNPLDDYALLTSNYPFAAFVTYSTTAANPITFTNPTPGAGTASPVAGVPGTYVSAYGFQANLKTQTAYQWNADIGYETWKGAAVEAQYQGTRGVHLDRDFYNNEPLHPVNTTVKSLNSQRPNQLFGSIRTFQDDEWANYNALNLILRQRMFHGLSGQVGYTWAHALDLSDNSTTVGFTANAYDMPADYANSNWDVRNRVVGSLTYAMPDLNGANLLAREVAGGWHVSAVVNIQSGMPYTVSMASATQAAGVDQGIQRPSWVHKEHAGCSLANAYNTKTSCIDETAYTTAVNYSTGAVGFGNLGRNSLTGPGFQYENLSVYKDFAIERGIVFQFRSAAYNLFNHPSGASPTSSGLGISTSGACAANSCLTFPSGFGVITGVQSVPNSFSGARVLELAGKLIF